MKQNSTIIERMKILYGGEFSAICAGIAAAFIVAYIFRGQVTSAVLLPWLGYVLSIYMARYFLLLDYNKNKNTILHHDVFEKRFVYAAGLTGFGWAFITAWGINLPVIEYRIYSLLLITALVALSVPLFSASIKAIYIYIAPMLIISIPLLLLRGGNETALGMMLIIYAVMVIRTAKKSYTMLDDTLSLRFKTQQQAENLERLHHDKLATEQLVQGIVDNSPAIIYVKNVEGQFIFVNQGFLKLLDLQREGIIGKTSHDIFPEDIADGMLRNDLEVQESGKPLEYEEQAPDEDGTYHYITTKFPLFDEDGMLYAVGGVSTDITERYRTEESLRLSQQRLLLHREQSPVGLIEWNTNFEFLDWNPAAEKIFGFTKEEVAGKHITKRILPESARPAVDKIWAELLANRGGTYSLNENTTKDGRTILCEWHNTSLVDHDGNVIGVTSLVDDVTQRQKNEESLRHSQKMDAIGKLTGGIAHDFNNMLAVILGFSELLKKRMSGDDPKLIKYSEEITTAGERAKKLTSKLLEFSRKAPSSNEATDINKLLNSMQHMLERTLTPRIKLKLELEENLWPVWIDKARLEDCILNMSINSMHAMPETGTLKLSTFNEHLTEKNIHNLDITPGDYVLLSVSDTGTGMNQEVRQKLFEPFFTTKGSEGTGLGMSQVYGFVQQSGGDIQVFSEPGRGTRIVVYMPVHNKTETDKIVDERTGSVELPAGHETILVVDDEVALLALAEDILTAYGYTVLRAENAEQALEILGETSVDLLLSDVIMPGMNGYQLATEVEKLYPEVKIQLVSGFSDGQKVNFANEVLHQQRLQKPVSTEKLLIRIRKLLNEE